MWDPFELNGFTVRRINSVNFQGTSNLKDFYEIVLKVTIAIILIY